MSARRPVSRPAKSQPPEAAISVRSHPTHLLDMAPLAAVVRLAAPTTLVMAVSAVSNVVSNTRVDIVARGVIKGCVEAGRNPADTIAIFRIPGAWEDDGFKILKKYGVEYCDRTVSMYEAAGRAVAKMQ